MEGSKWKHCGPYQEQEQNIEKTCCFDIFDMFGPWKPRQIDDRWKTPKNWGKKSTAEDIQSDFHLAWLTAGEAAEEAIVMWMLVKQRNPPHVFPFELCGGYLRCLRASDPTWTRVNLGLTSLVTMVNSWDLKKAWNRHGRVPKRKASSRNMAP